MPHTVESTISLSERDLARGAVDLYAEDITTAPPLLNSTILQKAVSVVKEAAPSIVETIVSHLAPVVPHHSGNVSLSGPGGSPQIIGVHEVMVSPPVETVVIVTSPANDTIPAPPPSVAMVIF
jgi:hypothetical protein